MAGDIQTYYNFLANRYANPDIWGTAGAYFNGLPNLGYGDSRYSIDPVGDAGATLNGQQYVRTGTADNSRFDQFGGGAIYDPTYGWVVPSNVAKAYSDADNSSELAFGSALGLMALPYAGATGLTSFGAGGDNVLNGMDLSSGITNVDAFNPTTLTSADEFGFGNIPGAIDESGAFTGVNGSDGFGDLSIYNDAAVGPEGYGTTPGMTTVTGVGGSGSSSLPGSLGSLQNIFTNGGSLPDYLKVAGAVGPSILGYLGASNQANAFKDAQSEYLALGAPYRGLLQNTFSPGYDISKEPGLSSALDTAFNTYMRAASAGRAGASKGNPFDNPGAILEGQKYLLGNVALPYLQNTRATLANAGGLGVNQSVPFGTGGIQAQGQGFADLGYGLRSLLDPKPDTGIIFMNGLDNGRYRLGAI